MLGRRQFRFWTLGLMVVMGGFGATDVPASSGTDETDEQVARSAEVLIQLQEKDGAWPYEGVYRVDSKIPVGYRIGGTAIVCQALMDVRLESSNARDEAIQRGVELILKELKDPRMKPSKENRYDVRVWGHIYALELFSRIKLSRREAILELVESTEPWIDRLVSALEEQQIDDGGWNYANRHHHASFVTAPALQALLLARQAGHSVSEEVLERGKDVLEASRTKEGAFQYGATVKRARLPAKLPGAIARNPICETTLRLLGGSSDDRIQASIDAFHQHWNELEKRRQKTGTHKPPYNVAPYYFYYGHRYLAQAIQMLPENQREQERRRFIEVLMKTRDDDQTWNDRVFPRSRAFGTAMAILAISQPSVPQARKTTTNRENSKGDR